MSPGLITEERSALDLLITLFLMQSRRLFDIFVMRADYHLVVSLVSTGALGPSLPNCLSYGWLLHIQTESGPVNCRTFHFPLFNFMSFLLAFFYKLFSTNYPLNSGTALWYMEMHMLPCKTSCYPCHLASFSFWVPQLLSAAVFQLLHFSLNISNLPILSMPEREIWSPALLLGCSGREGGGREESAAYNTRERKKTRSLEEELIKERQLKGYLQFCRNRKEYMPLDFLWMLAKYIDINCFVLMNMMSCFNSSIIKGHTLFRNMFFTHFI